MTFYTFKRVALAHKAAWQKLRFAAHKGYFLVGKRPESNPSPIAMYDSIDTSQIPASAPAVAGYVGGKWPTYPKLAALFPHALRLSIAVNAAEDAECLDVENGDATNDEAPAWVRRQRARGEKQPAIYSSVSNWPALETVLNRAGIRTRRKMLLAPQVRRFTAHYTYHAHLCTSACGYGFTGTADATQFDDHAFGKNLDASICSPMFFRSSL